MHSISQRVSLDTPSATASDVFTGHVPTFLCILLNLVLQLVLLINVARCSNFLIVDGFALADILDEFVHLGDAFVVFMQASDLAVQQVVLFVPHLKVLLQAVDIGAQRLVLISKLSVEILLEVQVTLHVCHFSIPKVELTSLLLIVLFHQSDSSHDIFLLILALLETLIKNRNLVLKCLFISIECSSQ